MPGLAATGWLIAAMFAARFSLDDLMVGRHVRAAVVLGIGLFYLSISIALWGTGP